jgi:hypothetical protein
MRVASWPGSNVAYGGRPRLDAVGAATADALSGTPHRLPPCLARSSSSPADAAAVRPAPHSSRRLSTPTSTDPPLHTVGFYSVWLFW